MKQKSSKYIILDKRNNEFLLDIVPAGYGKHGQIYSWHFTGSLDLAMKKSKKELKEILNHFNVDLLIDIIRYDDLEIRKLSITYEY